VLIERYAPTEQLAIAARAEYYVDAGEVVIATETLHGFQTLGYSVNFDVQVMEQVLWRLEGRAFTSRRDDIFLARDQQPTRENYFVGTSLIIRFP
jgi:hypothetical protein